ncbi:uncharacterized protein LOC100372175 [Saccoglossus kowalevskii]|uniref:Uncharacterized protein LOC100372175 n=1 Tax=Saccoglossus kowalevskii TaxID=10224 RepID=A0ABM0GTN8_SACKO|nr:PREDICTED: uncharacterized protein LOC100372175 [Saccoglossus kowalevskii]
MDVFHKINECELNPGDHIYVWKTMYLYSHHGIVAGRKGGVWQIIHFTPDEWKSKSTARIRITSLDEFREGSIGDIRLYRYGYPWIVCFFKRRGTCCHVFSDHVDVVLRRARECLNLGLPVDGEYHLLVNNCEHFCLYCKLGPNYKHLQHFSQAAF